MHERPDADAEPPVGTGTPGRVVPEEDEEEEREVERVAVEVLEDEREARSRRV